MNRFFITVNGVADYDNNLKLPCEDIKLAEQELLRLRSVHENALKRHVDYEKQKADTHTRGSSFLHVPPSVKTYAIHKVKADTQPIQKQQKQEHMHHRIESQETPFGNATIHVAPDGSVQFYFRHQGGCTSNRVPFEGWVYVRPDSTLDWNNTYLSRSDWMATPRTSRDLPPSARSKVTEWCGKEARIWNTAKNRASAQVATLKAEKANADAELTKALLAYKDAKRKAADALIALRAVCPE
jgi:hypothetical protein